MREINYKHIIWDWNGTLFDDAWLSIEVINKLLQKRNLPVLSKDRYQQVFDFPVRNYYTKVGFDFESEPFEIVATEFIDEYDRRRFECELQNSALDVLNYFKNSGVEQYLLSAYSQKTLREVVEHYCLQDFFSVISGLDDHYAGGKTENGKKLVQSLDLSPSEVLMVGDTRHDFEVATHIGMDCVLVMSGHQTLEKLKSCGVRVLENLEYFLQ
ncbi:HAD family hydrolase [Candidatus Riflebacteria bacterium]